MIGEHCRLYGHHWDSKWIEMDRLSFWDSMVCEECKAECVVQISRGTGKTLRRSYKYPAGYVQERKTTRAEVRRKVLGRRAVQK